MYIDNEIYNRETLDLKIDDKTMFRLKKPSLMSFIKIKNFEEKEDPKIEDVNMLVTALLKTDIRKRKVRHNYISKLDTDTKLMIIAAYNLFIQKVLNHKEYIIPSKPSPGKKTADKQDFMHSIKAVIDYSGLDYHRVLKMPVDTFMYMYKCAVVSVLEATADGRKYLEDCERLKQTKPDIKGLNRVFGKKEGGK